MPAIDEVLTRAVEAGAVPGVVASVASSDGSRYLTAFGAASTDPYRPAEVDTIFRIASMTKVVTSMAVMMLVDEGRISLDAPLAEYAPGFRQPEVLVDFNAASGEYTTRPATRDATIRELLSHSGGYGYWWLHEPLRIASGADPDLLHPPFLMADPGTGFAYSTSSDVVGLLFEPVTGLTLDRFFEERIFAPLGMPDSGFGLPENMERLSRVHRRTANGFRQLPLETEDVPPRGGGGLFSTAVDYSRVVRCLLRGGELDGTRILTEAAVRELSSNQIGEAEARMQRTALADRSNDFIFMDGSQKFGFGVMVETEQQPGKRSIGSYGWGGLVNTFYWVDPKQDLAAVLMMQTAPFASRPSIELLDQFEKAVYEQFSTNE